MLIINYHHIGQPPKIARYRGMYVTPNHLAWQITVLKAKGYHFVTVAEGIEKGLKSNFVALTFDDGYLDNLELGGPVFERLKIPVSIYVVAQDVGKKNHTWHEAGDQVPSDLLDWQQLKALQAKGHEIGSHALSHVHLAEKSIEEQTSEIENSFKILRDNLGHAPKTLAYPYGSYNEASKRIAQATGFIGAVTTERDGENAPGSDLFSLSRKAGKGYRVVHYLQAFKWLSK